MLFRVRRKSFPTAAKQNWGHSEFPARRIPPKTPTPSLIQTAFTPSQFEREANGLFDLRHHVGGKLTQLAFQPGCDQRSDTLDVDDGRLAQKVEVPYWDFIATAPMLRGERDVRDECAGSVRIKTRYDENGAGFGSQPKVS